MEPHQRELPVMILYYIIPLELYSNITNIISKNVENKIPAIHL